MILLDTSVLVSYFTPSHPLHSNAAHAIETRPDSTFVIAPQCVYELYAVATRPTTQRGFGYQPEQANLLVNTTIAKFTFVNDPRDLFERWSWIVQHFNVHGKTTHDARLVAWMLGHNVSELFTLNGADFKRYEPMIRLV